MAKKEPSLALVHENEITEDCDFCGQPFELDYRNSAYAVEIDGSKWVHSSCAQKFAVRIITLVKPIHFPKEPK